MAAQNQTPKPPFEQTAKTSTATVSAPLKVKGWQARAPARLEVDGELLAMLLADLGEVLSAVEREGRPAEATPELGVLLRVLKRQAKKSLKTEQYAVSLCTVCEAGLRSIVDIVDGNDASSFEVDTEAKIENISMDRDWSSKGTACAAVEVKHPSPFNKHLP